MEMDKDRGGDRGGDPLVAGLGTLIRLGIGKVLGWRWQWDPEWVLSQGQG